LKKVRKIFYEPIDYVLGLRFEVSFRLMSKVVSIVVAVINSRVIHVGNSGIEGSC
jgi:hypothetical protein